MEFAAAVRLNNGALIPSVGLGTWKSKKGEVGKAVKLAIQYGYRHIDCAHVYANEDEIGETLSEVFKEGKVKREDIFITSKLWCDSQAPEDVLPACKKTLENLKLDYLDLYLIHIPLAFKKGVSSPHSIAEGVLGYSPDRMAKTWQAMEQLVDKNLCKAIGISNFTIKKTQALLETARIVPACNQVELHPYLPQPELKKFSDSKGIILAAYSPLGSPDRPFVNQDDPILLDNPVLKEVADKHKSTPALVALAWGLHRGTPVLPKAVSENHIRQNLEVLQLKLDEEDLKAIENIGIRRRYLTQKWMFKPEEVPEDLWDGEE